MGDPAKLHASRNNVTIELRVTAVESIYNVLASVDGGISFGFVGHLMEDQRSFVGQPGIYHFDLDDRQAVLAAIKELWPEYKISVISIPPPGWHPGNDDEPPKPSPIILP